MQTHCEKEDQLVVKAVKPRPDIEAVSVNPKLVKQQIKEIHELLVETGIASSTGEILHADTLFCTDEKGYSARGVSKPRVVTTKGAAKRGTAATGERTFKHISVLGFIGLDGSSTGPGVMNSGKMVNTNWPLIWPAASFAVGPEGSCNIYLFHLMDTAL